MTARPARRGSARSDRGSVAVEFALLLPLLVVLIFGLIDFGRAINAQITLTQAAREGARALAIGEPDWRQRTADAATGLNLDPANPAQITDVADANGVAGCPAGSAGTDDAIVKVTYTFTFITPVGSLFGPTTTLTAEGVMPCE